MNKKDSGFVEKLLPVLLSTGIVFGVVICSGHFMGLFRQKEAINQVARAYLLEMETIGYLPVERLQSLRSDLSYLGLGEVALEGTSVSPVSYGAPIYLEIAGLLEKEIYLGIPFITQREIVVEIPIAISLISTAKH